MSDQDPRVKQVAHALQQLGSTSEQAEVMAKQLVKRAEQLSEQNKSSFLIELGRLLETVSHGAQGRLKPGDEGKYP